MFFCNDEEKRFKKDIEKHCFDASAVLAITYAHFGKLVAITCAHFEKLFSATWNSEPG